MIVKKKDKLLPKDKLLLFKIIAVLLSVAIIVLVVVEINQSKSYDESSGNQADNDVLIYNDKKYVFDSKYTNFIILGIDKKSEVVVQDVSGLGGQSDLIMILSLDNETKKTRILEVSRDSMTDIDLFDGSGNYYASYKAQLALQYAYGNGANTSCFATKKTTSKLLYNLPISSYMSLNLDGLASLCNEIGGITITFDNDYTYVDSAFEKGATMKLDSKQVEEFVRYRDTKKAETNILRMNRQTVFLSTFLKQLQVYVKQNSDLDKLYSTLKPYMVTDISTDNANKFVNYDFDNIQIQSVPGHAQQGEVNEEFIVDSDKLYEMIIEQFCKEK